MSGAESGRTGEEAFQCAVRLACREGPTDGEERGHGVAELFFFFLCKFVYSCDTFILAPQRQPPKD